MFDQTGSSLLSGQIHKEFHFHGSVTPTLLNFFGTILSFSDKKFPSARELFIEVPKIVRIAKHVTLDNFYWKRREIQQFTNFHVNAQRNYKCCGNTLHTDVFCSYVRFSTIAGPPLSELKE